MVFGVVFGQNQMEPVACGLAEMADAVRNGAVGTDDVQRDHRGDEASQHEQEHLQDVGPRHGGEPAGDGVKRRDEAQSENGGHNERAVAHPDDGVDGLGAEEEHGGQVHEDEQAKPEDGQDGLEIPRVAFFHEFGDRVDALLHEYGHKILGHDDEGEGGHKLVGGHRKAAREARARHSDELLCRDVGGNQRRAYRPPRQRLAREEIVLGGLVLVLFTVGNPDAQADYHQQISGENDNVYRVKCGVHSLWEIAIKRDGKNSHFS